MAAQRRRYNLRPEGIHMLGAPTYSVAGLLCALAEVLNRDYPTSLASGEWYPVNQIVHQDNSSSDNVRLEEGRTD